MTLLALAGFEPTLASAGEQAPLHFDGVCDGSAAVWLADGRLLVGSDRDNRLRIFEPEGGAFVDELDLYPHTEVAPTAHRNFSAFEGAAQLGKRIYWITSHARNHLGQTRPNRRRLLALEDVQVHGKSVPRPVAESYKDLDTQLSKAPGLARLGLARAIQSLYLRMPQLAPTKQGLSIQGLASMPGGRRLLIALRNPRPGNRALLIPIENPADVINGVADTRFGEPILLDLGGLGVSGLEYSQVRGSYLLLAARHDREGAVVLFEWSGQTDTAPVRLGDVEPSDLNAESLVVSRDGRRALVMSDDGGRTIGVKEKKECRHRLAAEKRCACDDLVDGSRKSFRARWVDLLPVPPQHSERRER